VGAAQRPRWILMRNLNYLWESAGRSGESARIMDKKGLLSESANYLWESAGRNNRIFSRKEFFMIAAKEESVRLIQQLPDECTLTDIIATLYFKQTVERGLEDIEEGRILTHEEIKKRMSQWAKSLGH